MKKIIRELLIYDRLLKGYPIYGTLRRYFIFIVGGGTGYLVAIGLTKFFTNLFGMQLAPSYALGLVAAVIFTFIYHRHVTFKQKSEWKRRFFMFSVVVIAIVVANWFLVILITEPLAKQFQIDLSYMVYWTTFFVTLMLSVVNFLCNRLWVFKK